MLDVKRRCAQTARISLHKPISLKERGHKTYSTPELLAYLPSCLQIFIAVFHHRFRTFPPPFPSALRFGEAAFTSAPVNPQAENDGMMTIFSKASVYPSKSAASHRSRRFSGQACRVMRHPAPRNCQGDSRLSKALGRNRLDVAVDQHQICRQAHP